MIDDFLVKAAWAFRSTYHTVLKSTSGAAVFGRDILFDIPYTADWTAIGQRRQASVDRDNTRENARRVYFDYAVGHNIMIQKYGHICKAEDKYLGPFTVTHVHTNGTIIIQHGTMSERINIRRVMLFFSEQIIILLKCNKTVRLYIKLDRSLYIIILYFSVLFLECKLENCLF